MKNFRIIGYTESFELQKKHVMRGNNVKSYFTYIYDISKFGKQVLPWREWYVAGMFEEE